MFNRTVLLFIACLGSFQALAKTLDEVIIDKVQMGAPSIQDLEKVAGRNRIRSWLPEAPTVAYSMNDNNSWKALSINTKLPFPLKSLYRDNVEKVRGEQLRVEARSHGQEILRGTVEVFLECAIPSEMIELLQETLQDQSTMAAISKSLYAAGAVPQADRVASELQLRQIEAQVRMQTDLAHDGCRRWRIWSGDEGAKEGSTVHVEGDIEDATLSKIELKGDLKRDALQKRYEAIVFSQQKLWSKYIPDIELTVWKNNYFDLIRSGGPPVKHTFSYTVGITLPFTFPFYDNSEYREEKALLGLDKIRTDIERSEAQKNWELAKKDYKRVKSRLEQISSTDLALAEAFVESSLASYRGGKIGFADLVLARRTKLDLKIEEVNLKAQKLLAKTTCLLECEL